MLGNIGWALGSILLVLIAVCSLIPYQPKTMLGIAGYWSLSMIGQAFAVQFWLLSLLLLAGSCYFNAPTYSATASCLCVLLYALGYWRGHNSQKAVSKVITAAIRPLNIPADFQIISKPRATLPAGLRPLKFNAGDVTCLKNISYGPHGEANQLDIYRPKTTPQHAMPVLVFVHGGGWVMGTKDEQSLPLLNTLAANGWLVASINYRLAPKVRFPDMIADVLNGISWVKNHAEEYGGNSDFMAISGNSAGGHLSSIATLATTEQLQALDINAPAAGIDVAAPLYGRYDFLNRHKILPGTGLEPFLVEKVMPGTPDDCPEIWALASPEDLVRKDAPPFLIIHGSGDAMIPVEEAREFTDTLKSVSEQAVDYLEIPGAQHGYDMVCSSWAIPTVYGILNYLNAHYAKHLQSK